MSLLTSAPTYVDPAGVEVTRLHLLEFTRRDTSRVSLLTLAPTYVDPAKVEGEVTTLHLPETSI